MEQLFEPAEIRTALLLISLARRDFEQGASTNKPPRINQATGDPPSPLAPPSSAFLLAISLALKLLLAFSWNPALSQSGKSNCCLHREPLCPLLPQPLYLCRAAAAAAVADCDVTGYWLDLCLHKCLIEHCFLSITKKEFHKIAIFHFRFFRTCYQDKNRPPLLFFRQTLTVVYCY